MYWGTKVTQKPTNMNQKLALPRPGLVMRPVNFGYQKYRPAKPPNTALPKSTSWKWATTKYVSCTAKSIGGEASRMPVTPPKRNTIKKPTAYNIGVSNVIEPRHIVPIQLKNFTPVGTAIRYVMRLKKGSRAVPVVNMWCAQTLVESAPIATVAKIIPR